VSGRFTNAALILAAAFGLVLVIAIPPFATPDEATHFFRAYQVSEGHLSADKLAHDRGAGGRLPSSVGHDVHQVDRPGPAPSFKEIRRVLRLPTGGARVFHDFRNTALYPPLTYAPQALAIVAGRAGGLSNLALMYLARLVNLAVFLLLMALAIRRFPRSPWFPAVVMLLPATMFLASSVSPDGVMVALCAVLVVETVRGDRPVWLLATALWLGLTKPPYFLLAGACVLLWLWRGRRGRLLPAATALAVLPAVIWSRWANHIFVPYRPIISPRLDVRPGAQTRHVLTHPIEFAGHFLDTASTDVWHWIGQALVPFGRGIDTNVPFAVVTAAFLVVAVFVAPRRGSTVDSRRAVAAFAIFAVLTGLATIVAVYIYSNAVGASHIRLVYGRYILPVLAPLLLLVPQPEVAERFGAARRAAVERWFLAGAGVLLSVTVFVVASSSAA
jgi:uncharacterized membrane protein